jgi:hypothetical protein
MDYSGLSSRAKLFPIRLTQENTTGPNSLFIRVLIDKKYELPYKVVDALVFHFIRLSNSYKARTRGDKDKLPVLWHQSLLAFAQRFVLERIFLSGRAGLTWLYL